VRFIDAGAPIGADDTTDDDPQSDSFSSRNQAALSWTSSLDLRHNMPLLCSLRDLRNDAHSGEVLFGVGGGITGELGWYLIGLGPYASAGGGVGVTSRGMAFLQFQGALGGGVGSFVGYGVQAGASYSKVPLKTGWQSSGGCSLSLTSERVHLIA
jgi:hypothetical protein